jgi:dienelactone hydrolase
MLGRTALGAIVTQLRFVLLGSLVLTLGANLNAQQPKRLSGSEGSPAVHGVLELPRTLGPHPAVVLLHGSLGWSPAYAHLARALADSGFVALAVDYFAETGRDTVLGQGLRMWPAWQSQVQNAVRYLGDQHMVDSTRIALVGFSRGAFLAVSVASSIPSVKAVVDFYGGINLQAGPIADQLQNFPPLLILHGGADTLVPVFIAYQLKYAVASRGGQVEMHIYQDTPHSFFSHFDSNNMDSTVIDAYSRMVGFLRSRLQAK